MIICGLKSSLELIFIRTKRREIPPKIWRFQIFFVPLPPKRIKKEKMDMKNQLTREELLLKVEASKARKRQRIAELEVRARELFKERTGEDPKYVYSL